MKNSLETKLGVFVLITILAAWLIIEKLGGTDMFSHGAFKRLYRRPFSIGDSNNVRPSTMFRKARFGRHD